MNTAEAIEALARRQGTSEAQVRADMIVAIHLAYMAKNPAFAMLFDDHEPSPEEYIARIVQDVSRPRILQ